MYFIPNQEFALFSRLSRGRSLPIHSCCHLRRDKRRWEGALSHKAITLTELVFLGRRKSLRIVPVVAPTILMEDVLAAVPRDPPEHVATERNLGWILLFYIYTVRGVPIVIFDIRCFVGGCCCCSIQRAIGRVRVGCHWTLTATRRRRCRTSKETSPVEFLLYGLETGWFLVGWIIDIIIELMTGLSNPILAHLGPKS